MLLGRENEQSTIATLLDEAWAGRGGALVLRGPPGIGKSTLLAAAVERADGMVVLRTQAVESEADLGLAALHQLLRPVAPLADRLPGPQKEALDLVFGRATGGRTDRFLVYSATLSLLGEAAEAQPLLCVVDDAHWLDNESARALTFAARRLGAERVAMLFAARDDAGAAGLDISGLPVLTVAGLDADAARALLEASAGRPVSRAVADRLLRDAGGNPLALVELSPALTGGQLSGVESMPDALPITHTLERAFLTRVRRLPDAAQRLLLVAAAETTGDLAAILSAATSLGDGPEALAPAEESGLVHTAGGRLEFRHPLVRSTVYAAATTAARTAAHRALAEVLIGSNDLERRTWHRAAAASAPDDAVAAALEEVADHASGRGAPAAASAALERAAQLLSAGGERRARTLWRAAEQARLAGEPARAADLLAAVRRTTRDPALRADVDLLHGAVELVAGSAESAERILLSAAHDVVATDPGRAMQLLVIASQAAALADDSTGAAEIARVAAVLPRGDAVQEDFFLDLLVGSCAYLSGDLAAAVEPLRRVIRHAEDVSQSMRLTWAARAAFYLGDDESASRFESRAVALARGAGAMGDLLPPLQRLALTDICLGRWSAAKANASEALRLAHDTGQPNLASLPSSWLALLAAYRQQASDLDEQVAAAHELLSRHPMTVAEHALLWARAVAEATAGNADVALEHLTGVTSSGIALLSSLDRIEIAVQAGDLEQAEAWLLPLVAFASGTGAPWAKARVAHCRALLADVADAGQHYEHSLTWHRAAQRPFERARTELAFGEFLRRNGGRVDARSHLRAARTIFDDLGAQHWTERTDQELRASGEKIRRAAPSSLPHLTAQELQVATLVAQGLSNREAAAQLFVSTRTVEYHLRNVFTKLGLTSRTQLAQPGALPR